MIGFRLALRRAGATTLACSLLACGGTDDPASSASESGTESASTETSDTNGEDWSESNAEVDTTASGDGDGDSTTSGDGDGGDGDGDGDLSCGAAIICMQDCAPTDLACVDACLDIADAEGRAEAEAVLACSVANSCYTPQCLETVCAAEMLTCTSGEQNCSQLWDCVVLCDGDEDCNAECAFASTPLAQSQVTVLVECLETSGCADENCILETCGDPWLSCTDEMSDSYSCPALLACWDGCEGAELCGLSCAATAETDAQSEAEAVLTCAQANACTDDLCLETNCGPELGLCASGEQDCGQLAACVMACGGAGLCTSNCLADATSEAQDAYQAIISCAELNACADQACIDTNCGAELAACAG